MAKRPGNGQPEDLPWTVARLVRAFGGVSEFGRSIGVTQQTASEMLRRQRIASKHWARIIEEGAKLNFDLRLRDLLAMQAPTEGSREAARKRRKREHAEPPA